MNYRKKKTIEGATEVIEKMHQFQSNAIVEKGVRSMATKTV